MPKSRNNRRPKTSKISAPVHDKDASRVAQLVADELRDALHSMLETQLRRDMASMVVHAIQGRGFRLVVAVTNADGTPWEPDKKEPEQERRIIMPYEQ